MSGWKRILNAGAAIIAAGVAINEWIYSSTHPYRAGASAVIAWLAVAVFLIAVTGFIERKP